MTLIEAMFALVALMLLLGVAAAYVRTSVAFARRRTEERVAREIALSQIEMLRAGVTRRPRVLEPALNRLDDVRCRVVTGGYEKTPHVRKITVSVRWKSGKTMRCVCHEALVPWGGDR